MPANVPGELPPMQAKPTTHTSTAPESKVPVLPSHTLLGNRQVVDIEHNGQRYRLQTTKAGKLILTK